MAIRIFGTGHYTPERILTNADLEKIVDTSDEWITTRTGIKQRHIAPADMPTSEMALIAAQRAIEDAGIDKNEIGFISVATATADYRFPSTACVLQGKLGIQKCACYDIAAACSGLLYSLDIGTNLLRGHKNHKYGLIVGAEKLSFLADWSDRATCVLFGDAASAVIIGRDDSEEEDFLLGSDLGADGSRTNLLIQPAGGTACPSTPENVLTHAHHLNMEGPEVFKLAVPAMVRSAKKVLEETGISSAELRWVIPHQANKRIIDAVFARLEVEPEQMVVNIENYGNTSAASIGICLDMLNRNGQLRRGDLVLMTSFGAGLTWATTLIRW